jgi:cytochrome c oxidase subunit 3
MGFLDHLMEKPWLPGEGQGVSADGKGIFSLPTPQLGLRVFLGVASVLFSLFIVAYVDRMTLADWRPLPDPWLLWVNTALLVASSVAMHRAWIGADRGRIDLVKKGVLAAGGFAFAFLVGQLLAWQQLTALGYFAAANPANAFFYLFTALHALHLLGGLVAWGRTTAKVQRGFEPSQVHISVELCAIYWHFLLVVWLILFGLLLLT